MINAGAVKAKFYYVISRSQTWSTT